MKPAAGQPFSCEVKDEVGEGDTEAANRAGSAHGFDSAAVWGFFRRPMS